jgi:signal transduction histidine kinase/DNA-binding response OmpR family regulator/HAMP domain-containing protein
MIGRWTAGLQRRSIARTLQLALLGLTVALALIGAIGISALYDARQQYEDQLAASSALEIAATNLLTATVALESNLARSPSPAAAGFVSSAARAFDTSAERVLRLAAADARSRRLAVAVLPARRDAQALAEEPTVAAARRRMASDLAAVRDTIAQLIARQPARREQARATAASHSRTALVAIVAGAGLALVCVIAFLTLLIRTMRQPLDELVAATRRMAAGDLAVRVQAAGPTELELLGTSFNKMGEDLAAASRHIETQHQRLATTVESLGDGLIICDASDHVTTMNPRATAMVASLRPGSPTHAPNSPLPQLADALAGEVTVQHGNGTLAVTAARLAGPEAGVVWTLRDITERARLEQAKSDFVATASHELRSPLTSIKGFMELLEATSAENLTDRQNEFIRIVLQSTDRLVDLVNDLLDLARIESGHFQIDARACDLRAAVAEVATLMQPRLEGKRQQLHVDIREPRPPALADPARVRQIITNLVTNAHLYTDEGGTITLVLEGDARRTRISVADSGRGMSDEDVGRVFDRFYRGSSDERKAPGTGLGLAIVKSLVDLHGGSIDVQSQPGRGTTFTVSLPAAPGTAVTGGSEAIAPGSAHVSRRVLIVDDEPAVAALIAAQLWPLGVQAVQAHSGSEALKSLHDGHFDAMTLDILMPDMDGFEVLKEVRTDPKLRNLPVIFVSVSSRLAELQGEWAISKPIDRRRLIDVLDAAIKAKRSRVLIVAPESVRTQLGPSLSRLGIEHRWESSAEGAARAGAEELFEVALVHASMSSVPAVFEGVGAGRSVIIFSSDGGGEPNGVGIGMPVFPLPQAVSALRSALGERGPAEGT